MEGMDISKMQKITNELTFMLTFNFHVEMFRVLCPKAI